MTESKSYKKQLLKKECAEAPANRKENSLLSLPGLKPDWGLCLGDGFWMFLQCASRCVDVCWQLAGAPVSWSTSQLSLSRVTSSRGCPCGSANATRAHKVRRLPESERASERARLLLTKDSVVAREGNLGKILFSLKHHTAHDLTEKHTVSSVLPG